MLPTYSVSKLAREHVTVVLTGDGGDEIFAGYEHYQLKYRINRIPLLLRILLGCPGMLLPDSMSGKKCLRDMTRYLALRFIRVSTLFPEDSRPSMFSPEHFAQVRDHNSYEQLLRKFRAVSDLDITAQMQYVDAHAYLNGA